MGQVSALISAIGTDWFIITFPHQIHSTVQTNQKHSLHRLSIFACPHQLQADYWEVQN